MKIIRKYIPVMPLKEFAEQHDLVLEFMQREKEPPGSPMRFYCYFLCAEVKEGMMLSGAYGNGATEEDAVMDYCNQISGRPLVIGAYTDQRREIRVPQLTFDGVLE